MQHSLKPLSFLTFTLFLLNALFINVSCIAEAKELIDTTLEKIVSAVEKYPGEGEKERRRTELFTVIKPHFDFPEMAKRCLGAQWSKATKEEQSEFVTVFSQLLARTYLSKIELAKRNMVKVMREESFPPTSVGVKRASVHTLVTYKGEEFPIDYKLYNAGKGWQVYDVIVENIGLVANYRTEFAGVIRNKGLSGLIADLNKR
jgi:phospholipid transport system substrate-binding protein